MQLLTIGFHANRQLRRSPIGTNSMMRDRGRSLMMHPTIFTTWGFTLMDTLAISAISSRKDCISTGVEDPVVKVKFILTIHGEWYHLYIQFMFQSHWQPFICFTATNWGRRQPSTRRIQWMYFCALWDIVVVDKIAENSLPNWPLPKQFWIVKSSWDNSHPIMSGGRSTSTCVIIDIVETYPYFQILCSWLVYAECRV